MITRTRPDLKALAKKRTWWQVAEGCYGLAKQQKGKPSRRRLPLAAVEKLLSLCHGKYFDLNTRHFHEKG
jgi:hypothetical protein